MAYQKRALNKTNETTTGLYDNVEQTADPVSQAGTLSELRKQGWKQWLTILALVFSDMLLALAVWEAAFILQGLWQSSSWGRGPLSEVAAASTVTSMAVWIGMRAVLGLYPGYGLGEA